MKHQRRGGTTSIILAIAGVVGVGVAGGMALTGTTPCSILKACGVKSDAPAAQTVALEGATVCPITGKTMEASTTTAATATGGDCCSANKAASVQAAALATDAKADCSNDPECAVDDGIACSTKGADCHKVQQVNAVPASSVEVQVVTAAHGEGEVCAHASSCSPANCTEGMMKACTESGKVCPQDKSAHEAAPVKATPAAPVGEVFIAPDAIRPYRVLAVSGKGVPMLVPAALKNASACETKPSECGGCGGSENKQDVSTTTASLR